MDNNWQDGIDKLSAIQVCSSPNNEPVIIQGDVSEFRCIGIGTDAAVFQSLDTPDFAFKVYDKEKIEKVQIEANVYDLLSDSPYFPKCYAAEGNILVLSFEQGTTLFDCILQGIHIPHQVVEDVEAARDYVRSKGLNPRDIHLKNIIMQDGRAKIIDVSEYVLPGNDFRWEHLKKGYEQYYHLFDGNTVPFWIVETVRKWYNQRVNTTASFDDFTKTMLKLFGKK